MRPDEDNIEDLLKKYAVLFEEDITESIEKAKQVNIIYFLPLIAWCSTPNHILLICLRNYK